MGSILKSQVLKHLSKFTKNLSADNISISTLKGEGEIFNLELDELILMDLLELPTWLKLNKATCNKVSIKIHWTKLKSQPIQLFLDEVLMEIETCSELRATNNSTQNASYRSEERYGFIDKVMDGIHVHINSVSVQLKSDKFHASLQLLRVTVQSLTPSWYYPTDIRQTRIRSESTDEILLFKEIHWQTTRIEANAQVNESDLPLTPLRLIANQSKIRIVLKKRLSDRSMLASRISFFLDDLLWVLMDTQLKAVILFCNSLSSMIEKSAKQSQSLAAEKLQKQGQWHSKNVSVDQHLLQQQTIKQYNQTSEGKLFQKYDVLTTSYHLISSRIDLHLCNDTAADTTESCPKHNSSIHGGTMQMIICKFSLDYYPYHFAGGERKNWPCCSENQGSRNVWVQELFKAFGIEVTKAKQTCSGVSHLQSSNHISGDIKSIKTTQQQMQKPNVKNDGFSQDRNKVVTKPLVKLLEVCTVLRIEEFIIYKVSTAGSKRHNRQKLLCSDKKLLNLPSDMSMIHMEYTNYFFTDGLDIPVPHANLYVQINPLRLNVDFLTILWANDFLLSLAQMVESHTIELDKHVEHVDVKIEALMPRIVLSAEEKVENQPDYPSSVQIQISKLSVSNTQVENGFTLSDLRDLLDEYKRSELFHSSEFPNDGNNISSSPKIFHDFANKRVNPYLSANALDLVEGRLPSGYIMTDFENNAMLLLKTNSLKRNKHCDIWCLCSEQIWLEFLGVPTSGTRPVPFVESFPLTLWVCNPSLIPETAILLNSVSENGSLRSKASEFKDDIEIKHEKENRKTHRLLKEYYCDESQPCGSSDLYTAKVLDNVEANSGNSNVHICDKRGNVQCSSVHVADANIVAKIKSKILVQLNNPQYLFLMRLIESITNFQMQLNADTACLTKGLNSLVNTISVSLVIPELEISIVCPYIAESLAQTNQADILCSPTSESSGDHTGCRFMDFDKQEEMKGYDEKSDEQREQLSLKADVTEDSHSSESVSVRVTEFNFDNISQMPQVTVSDSGISSAGTALTGQLSRSESMFTPIAIRKSFTSDITGFSNLNSTKMKNKLGADYMFDDIDSISLQTNTSEEGSFDWIMNEDCEAPFFEHQKLDTASYTDTDGLSSVFSDRSGSRYKGLVSVVVFHLTGVELLIQSSSEGVVVGLQAQAVDTKEIGNIIYNEFYEKLLAQIDDIGTEAMFTSGKYPLKFKYTTGSAATQQVPGGLELGLMDIRTKGHAFKFNMTSVLNLASFMEDEKNYSQVPTHVTVEDLRITLVEDRPSLKSNLATPDIVMNIHRLFMYLHGDGVFHITADNVRTENFRTAEAEAKTVRDAGARKAEFEAEEARTAEVEHQIQSMSQDVCNQFDLNNSSVKSVHNETGQKSYLDLSSTPTIEEFQQLQNHNQQLQLLLSRFETRLEKHELDHGELNESDKQLDNITTENKLTTHYGKDMFEDVDELQQNNNGLMFENCLLKEKLASIETKIAKSHERVCILEEEKKKKEYENESILEKIKLIKNTFKGSEFIDRAKTFIGDGTV